MSLERFFLFLVYFNIDFPYDDNIASHDKWQRSVLEILKFHYIKISNLITAVLFILHKWYYRQHIQENR